MLCDEDRQNEGRFQYPMEEVRAEKDLERVKTVEELNFGKHFDVKKSKAKKPKGLIGAFMALDEQILNICLWDKPDHTLNMLIKFGVLTKRRIWKQQQFTDGRPNWQQH